MTITIKDLLDLLLLGGDVQEIRVHDFATQKDIFNGTGDDLPEEIEEMEIQSIDNIGEHYAKILVVNVNTEEE